MIKKQIDDFDSEKFWREINFFNYDVLISSSAFQWSKKLEFIFQQLKEVGIPIYISLFTNRTFYELHQELNIQSPLYSTEDILKFASGFHYEILDYKLTFSSRLEALRYIKKSGVSGGEKRGSTVRLKKFINIQGTFPLSFQSILIR